MGGGGGSGGGAGAATEPPPAPLPTPPITPANQAVIDVQQATRRQALRRNGLSSTVYAGATGGWFPQPSAGMGQVPQMPSAPALGGGNGKTGG